MKKILIIIAALALVAVSCDKTPKNEPVGATVALTLNGAPYAEADITITLRELNGTAAYESRTDAEGVAAFSVLPGFYEATASFKVAEEGNLYVYNGVNSNITVVKGDLNSNNLELTQSVTNQLVIKELYVGGCTSDDGSKSFQNDAYVIIYNNSDTPADASKLCFAGIAPANAHATNKYLVSGALTYASQGWLPAAQAFWWFDTQVTIQPWSQIVIAMKGAIDHTATYSNSVDLSKADYAMYDPESGFNQEATYPAPSASIPTSNYLQTFPFSAGKAWTLSVMCPAFVMFQSDAPETLAQNSADYDLTLGDKQPSVKVPNADVVDGVEVFLIGKEDSSNKRLTSDVDAGFVMHTNKMGYTVYRNVDKAATEALEGNKEKLVYNYAGGTSDIPSGSTDPSGIDAEASIRNGAVIVYQDTNNSTKDFHLRKISSLK